MIRHVRWQMLDDNAASRPGIVAVKWMERDNIVIVRTLAGEGLPAKLLFPVLNLAFPDWVERAEKLHQSRKNPWTVVVRYGMSGCRDYRLYALKDEELMDQQLCAELHVSMYGKLNEGVRLWAGDLPPLLEALLDDYSPHPQKEEVLLGAYEPELRGAYKSSGEDSGLQAKIEALQALDVLA